MCLVPHACYREMALYNAAGPIHPAPLRKKASEKLWQKHKRRPGMCSATLTKNRPAGSTVWALRRTKSRSCAKIRTFAPTTCCRHWVTPSTRPGCAIIAARTCSASNGAPENSVIGVRETTLADDLGTFRAVLALSRRGTTGLRSFSYVDFRHPTVARVHKIGTGGAGPLGFLGRRAADRAPNVVQCALWGCFTDDLVAVRYVM